MTQVKRFCDLPKIDPASANCVRWNPKRQLFELVLDGEVKATASRLKMSIGSEARKFGMQVRAAVAARNAQRANG